MEGAMRQSHFTLTGKDVQEHAGRLLQRFLGLVDFGRKCKVEVVLHVLFYAASRLMSICAACQRLTEAPCDSALFKALLATLPEYAELQRRGNRALSGRFPTGPGPPRPRRAPDFTLLPY